MQKLIIGATVLALVAGCQNVSNRQLGTAAGGAIIGAGVGVLAGGDDKRNAAVGAVIGGIAGAAVGGYMDKQEEKLRQQTAGTGIEVERQGDQIALTMPSSVTFPVDSSRIQPSFQAPLTDVANTLLEFPSTTVDIVGHASSDGADDYNLDLSIRRAQSVQSFLIARGVQDIRLNALGMGETRPIADNATAAGRAANRRVEILLTPVVEG
ncbi:OmpA family protein [Hyphomonas sp. FCG-A18]|uniref:OmpA family protein n=1 Tax=Hyphomonas sp. FCG-A18 TaxID=3080019 RepID=UPI002B2CDF48|nr:OmpA family protein [Hyphomonas sp. FCG-A18]